MPAASTNHEAGEIYCLKLLWMYVFITADTWVYCVIIRAITVNISVCKQAVQACSDWWKLIFISNFLWPFILQGPPSGFFFLKCQLVSPATSELRHSAYDAKFSFPAQRVLQFGPVCAKISSVAIPMPLRELLVSRQRSTIQRLTLIG